MERRDGAAYNVLRAQYNFLKTALQGSRRELLDECFSKKLVSLGMMEEINNADVQRGPAQGCAQLLGTLMKNGNEGVFQQFVEILRSIPTAEYLAKRLQEEYLAQQQQPQLAEYEGPTEMSQPMNSTPVLMSEDFNLVQPDADPVTLPEHTDKTPEPTAIQEIKQPISPESQLLNAFLKCNHDEAMQLLSTRGCDPAVIKDDSGKTLLHLACRFDHEWLDVVQCLFKNHHCDPNAKDHSGNTPLHDACRYRSCTTIEYLLSKQPCDPNAQNAEDNTPLHVACTNGFKDVVQVLLSSGKVEPEVMNSHLDTPLDVTVNEDIRAMISLFTDCIEDPFIPSVKVFMVGSYSSNRTAIVQEILEKVDETEKKEKYKSFIEKSEGRMSGIIPLPFHTKELGPVLFYDVRHSSSSLPKMIPPGGSCVFLVGINLAESDFKISKCLQEWLAKIGSCFDLTNQHLVVVGNNPELDPVCLNEKTILVERVCKGSSVKYAGCAPIRPDVALSFNDIHELYSYLGESILALKSSPALNYSHTYVYHQLQKSFADRGFCTTSELASRIENEGIPLPRDPSQLVDLLSLLSDEGPLLLLRNDSELKESWVILDQLKLLEDIASVFVSYQQQGCDSGDPSVIPFHQFSLVFPKYNPTLVAELLASLQFIHEITDVHRLQSLTTDHPCFVQYYCFHCTEEEHEGTNHGTAEGFADVGLQGVPAQAETEHFSTAVEEMFPPLTPGCMASHIHYSHDDEESPPASLVPQRPSTEGQGHAEGEVSQPQPDDIINCERTSWFDDHEQMISRICIFLLLVVLVILVILVIPIPFMICVFCFFYYRNQGYSFRLLISNIGILLLLVILVILVIPIPFMICIFCYRYRCYGNYCCNCYNACCECYYNYCCFWPCCTYRIVMIPITCFLLLLVILVIPIPFMICLFCYHYRCCCYRYDCCYRHEYCCYCCEICLYDCYGKCCTCYYEHCCFCIQRHTYRKIRITKICAVLLLVVLVILVIPIPFVICFLCYHYYYRRRYTLGEQDQPVEQSSTDLELMHLREETVI